MIGFSNSKYRAIMAALTNLKEEIKTMSQTLEQQIQAATAASQAALTDITTAVGTISTNVAALQAQIVSLQGQLVPGTTVTPADAQALENVATGLAAEQATLDALAQSSAPPAPVVNPGT